MLHKLSDDARRERLRQRNVDESLIPEILAHCSLGTDRTFDAGVLPDRSGVFWERLLPSGWLEGNDALRFLHRCYPALGLGIDSSLHTQQAYLEVITGGRESPPVRLDEYENARGINLTLAHTWAGTVPILRATHRLDFERLLQKLARRNRAAPPPAALGAMYVNGLHNVMRASEPPGDVKDRLILISSGPYAALSAGDVGLSDAEWLHCSVNLRTAHELTHYVLHMARGMVSKSITEELIADAEAVRSLTCSCKHRLLQQLLGVNAERDDSPRFIHYLPATLKPASDVFAAMLNDAIPFVLETSLVTLSDFKRLSMLSLLGLDELAAQ
jgi:hypothetical protein